MWLIEEIKAWPWHWERGEHNGIPKCCRTYFLFRTLGWTRIICYVPGMYDLWDRVTRNREWYYGYIHCPYHAITNKSVRIHDCREDGCVEPDSPARTFF